MQKRGAGNRRKLAGFTAAMAASCTIVLGTGGTAWAASAGEGRGYALEVKAGVSLVDLGLDIPLVDTGLQSAPPAFNVSGKMLDADIGGATNSLISLKAGVLSASTGSSLAQNRVETTAGISDINLSIAGVVAIKADVLQSQVHATCVNGAVQPTGAATIENLSISVLGIPVPIPLNPSPNTGLNTGILEIVFNEQTPVDGGMEVNALRIGAKIPTLADVNLVLGHSQASLADCTAAQGDITPPAVDITTSPVINADNQEAYIVAGSCTAGDGNVKVTIGTAPKFVTMTTACNAAGAWTAPAANVASLPLGPVDITATQTDAAGNTGTRSVITTKTTAAATDTTAPVVAVVNAAAINAGNEHGYTVSGTCTAGDGDVRVRIGTAPNSVEPSQPATATANGPLPPPTWAGCLRARCPSRPARPMRRAIQGPPVSPSPRQTARCLWSQWAARPRSMLATRAPTSSLAPAQSAQAASR